MLEMFKLSAGSRVRMSLVLAVCLALWIGWLAAAPVFSQVTNNSKTEFADIPGWRDLRPKFVPSEFNRARSFALYVVRDGQAKPLAELAFDVPPDGADSQWVMLSALGDVTVDLNISGTLREHVSVWREQGEGRLRSVQRLELKQGDIVPLVLTLDGAGLKGWLTWRRTPRRVGAGRTDPRVETKVWEHHTARPFTALLARLQRKFVSAHARLQVGATRRRLTGCGNSSATARPSASRSTSGSSSEIT